MSKKIVNSQESKKVDVIKDKVTSNELSKDDKKELVESIREEMITDEEYGPLHIDEKYLEDGYVYRKVDSDRPGRVAFLQKIGYDVVHDPDIKVGDNSVSKSSPISSAVTMELGMTSPRQGVLMRIPVELYEKRKLLKRKRNQAAEQALKQTGVPTQFGELTIGTETLYKK